MHTTKATPETFSKHKIILYYYLLYSNKLLHVVNDNLLTDSLVSTYFMNRYRKCVYNNTERALLYSKII